MKMLLMLFIRASRLHEASRSSCFAYCVGYVLESLQAASGLQLRDYNWSHFSLARTSCRSCIPRPSAPKNALSTQGCYTREVRKAGPYTTAD